MCKISVAVDYNEVAAYSLLVLYRVSGFNGGYFVDV